MKDKVLFGIVAVIVIVVAIGAVTTFVMQVNNTGNVLEEEVISVVEETPVLTPTKITTTVNNADAVIEESISLEEFLEIFPEKQVKGLKIGDKRLLNESCQRYNIENEDWTNEWYWTSYNGKTEKWEKAIVYQERLVENDNVFQIRVAYDGESGNGMRKDEIINIVFSQNKEDIEFIPLYVVKNMLEGFKY